MTAIRRYLACVAVALSLVGCGGGASSKSTTTTSSTADARAVWAQQTQQLCREKRAAIAGLGDIHITYGGIAREGLPAVKRLLDRYLVRLLAVLHDFSLRQQQLTTPASVSAMLALAEDIDRKSQAATRRLRVDLARTATAAQFSAVFRSWIATEQRLAVRGDTLAQQLSLPSCHSGVSSASP
jgi:hypothetical protein